MREPYGTAAQRIVCGVAEYSLQSEFMSDIIALCKLKNIFRINDFLHVRMECVVADAIIRIASLIIDAQMLLPYGRYCSAFGWSESDLCRTCSPLA